MTHSKPTPQQSKRRREEQSDGLSSDSEDEVRGQTGNWAAWLVVEGTDTSRPLSALSPFAVQKGFSCLAGQLKSIKRLRNGTFLVECHSATQSKKLQKATTFVDRAVKISPHKSLNSSKGVIRCPDLKGVSEAEIKEELRSQGVVEVRRAMFRKGGDLVPTNTIFLTFCMPTLPQSIKVGYLNVKVSLYVPSPLRCFRCQKFGHVRDRCPGEEVCGTCAQATHQGSCANPPCCVNCKGEHPSSSRDCPMWKTEEAIQRIKTEKKISFLEARKLVQPSQPARSYAQVVKTQVRSVECQTTISCFRDDIPGFKVVPESIQTKTATVQTLQSTEKSPAPRRSSSLDRPSEKSAAEGGRTVDPSMLPLGHGRKSDKAKTVSPAGRPSGGGSKDKESGKVPVVVDTLRPPPKPLPKPAPNKNQRSRSGGGAERVKKAEVRLDNRFSVLQRKEGELDAEEEMDKG